MIQMPFDAAKADCVAQIEKIVETLGSVSDKLDALSADNIEAIATLLLSTGYNVQRILSALTKEPNE